MSALSFRGELWFFNGNSTGRARLFSKSSSAISFAAASTVDFKQGAPFWVFQHPGGFASISFTVSTSAPNLDQANFPTDADPAVGCIGTLEIDTTNGRDLYQITDGSAFYDQAKGEIRCYLQSGLRRPA